MTLRPVMAEYPVFMYVDVSSYLPLISGPPLCIALAQMLLLKGFYPYPFVTITAQRKRAKKVGGTTTPFTQKRIRSFDMGIRARAVWQNQ